MATRVGGHAARARRTCCCRRSTPSRRASAGSARARSTTSASGWPCRRPRPTASRRSTRCSRRRRGRRRSCTSATTSRAGCAAPTRSAAELEAERLADSVRAIAVPGRASATLAAQPVSRPVRRAPAALVSRAGARRADSTLDPRRTPSRERAASVGDGPRSRPARYRLTALGSPSAPQTRTRVARRLRLLRRVGIVDPASLDDYRAHGGYAALRRALALGPDGVIREVTDSKLLGRGGAAFPDRPQVGGRRASSRRARTTSSATRTSPSPARSRIAC